MRAIVIVCACSAALVVAQAPRPQDDLFLHANEAWLRDTPIPADRVTFSAAHELVDRIEQQIQDIVDELKAAPRRTADGQRIVDLYTSVIDDDAVERLGLAPVQEDLARLEAIDSVRRASEVAGYMASVAAGGIFSTQLATEGRRGLVATVRPGGILLPDAGYYLTPSPQMLAVRREYAQYLARVNIAAGVPRETAEADAGTVLRLETRLAELLARADGSTGARLTLAELAERYPGFDWVAWARPQGIDRARAVFLTHPEFFEQFAVLMAKTPPETLRAWLRGRYLTAMAPYLPREFSDIRFQFFGIRLTGQKAPRPAWKRGVSMVGEMLGDAVGREYVRRHFPDSSKALVDGLVAEVLQAARETVGEATWVEPAGIKVALDYLDTLSVRIGSPDEWRSYAGLTIRPGERLGNLRRLRAFESRYQLRRMRGEADLREWLVGAHSVNAFYGPAQRAITIPAGILQPPYFDPAADPAANYGAIGAVVGHEVSHALHVRALEARATELRRQFAAFEVVPGVRVNANLTLSENIADLIGLQFAHRAYRRSLGGRAAPVIDGLSGDQRFFLGWARIWRAKSRPDFLRSANETSPHAPSEFRANGAVVHLDAFHAAFQVAPGDRMYRAPDRRVRVW